MKMEYDIEPIMTVGKRFFFRFFLDDFRFVVLTVQSLLKIINWNKIETGKKGNDVMSVCNCYWTRITLLIW